MEKIICEGHKIHLVGVKRAQSDILYEVVNMQWQCEEVAVNTGQIIIEEEAIPIVYFRSVNFSVVESLGARSSLHSCSPECLHWQWL